MTSTIDTSILKQLGINSPTAAPASASTSTSSTSNSQLSQQDFLKLLTTQLKNQDPMQPMQNGQFMSQMAQFGTVQGIQSLQQSFANFSQSMTSGQSLMAASLVGHNVLVPSQVGTLDASGMSGAVDVPNDASAVNVNIYDSAGQLVRSLPLGSQLAGTVSYHWDGLSNSGQQAAPGTYVVKAQAVSGGSTSDLQNLSAARVNSVTLGKSGSGLTLSLAGLGDTAFSQVRQIQ